jgi:hypothetical protein
MKYQKPEVVLNGTAINSIEAGLDKGIDNEDSRMLSTPAYRADE